MSGDLVTTCAAWLTHLATLLFYPLVLSLVHLRARHPALPIWARSYQGHVYKHALRYLESEFSSFSLLFSPRAFFFSFVSAHCTLTRKRETKPTNHRAYFSPRQVLTLSPFLDLISVRLNSPACSFRATLLYLLHSLWVSLLLAATFFGPRCM